MEQTRPGHEVPTLGDIARHRRFASGVTLLEVMVAASILIVASLGALHCQYYVAGHGRIAEAVVTATHTAQLLLEDWKSTGGSEEYDPSSLSLGFSEAMAIPTGFTTPGGLGAALNDAVYSITLNDVPMQVMLKYLNVIGDDDAETTLTQLAVIVHFETSDDGEDESRFEEIPPVILVTYVRRDASNG